MNLYLYDGPVMEFDNCVANRWTASTRAVSEKKARSNLTYQFKKKNNRLIYGKILIHHMNPISVEDILKRSDFLLNPEYLISTILTTHNAIHYGDESLLITEPIVRSRNDTCPWKR